MLNRAGIIAAFVGLAVSTGCSVGWSSPTASVLTVTMRDAETKGAESVFVQTEAGDIELIATDGPSNVEAHIYAQTQERADATRIKSHINAEGQFEVSIDWPEGGRRDNESCDIVVRMPRMDGVRVRTGAGEIDVKGMAGQMHLETGAGDVDVEHHMGSVTATTSAGDIEIENVTGNVSATTRAGDVELERIGGTIEARTSAGDIEAEMTGPYTGTIVAGTSVGDLRVMGRAYSQKRVTLAIGDGPEISTFESTVGDVSVRVTGN